MTSGLNCPPSSWKSYRRCEEKGCRWCGRRSALALERMCWSQSGRRKRAVLWPWL